MKRIPALFFLFLCSGSAHAQATLEFTTHMTGNSDFFGDGMFSLSGNVFAYDLRTDFIFNIAEIHGPASSGQSAPSLFNLSLRRCEPPLGQYRGGCFYKGDFTLSQGQITELVNEQWYVYSFSGEVGELFLRGQIVQVPEPSTFSLIALGIGLACWCFWRRSARKSLE